MITMVVYLANNNFRYSLYKTKSISYGIKSWMQKKKIPHKTIQIEGIQVNSYLIMDVKQI